MASLGLDTYRFSVSWPRVQPDGTGPANPPGLDFYDRLVDELLAAASSRCSRSTTGTSRSAGGRGRLGRPRHGGPLRRLRRRRSPRARRPGATWTTLNEPWCSAFLGYASASTRPGRKDPRRAGRRPPPQPRPRPRRAGDARRCAAAQVSIALNPAQVRPGRRPAERPDAARRVDALRTGSSSTRCCAASTRPT